MHLTKQTDEVPALEEEQLLDDGRLIVCLFKAAEDICKGQENREREERRRSFKDPGGAARAEMWSLPSL